MQTEFVAKSALLAAAIVAASCALQGHLGFSLSDEGFLWYGAQRVMLGEVPIRDFMAYDPGRYYWSAILMHLQGDSGVISLRTALAMFHFVGVFIALLLLGQSFGNRNTFLYLLATITLVLWMFPRHKIFDVSLSIALVGMLAKLAETPSCRRYFQTGLVVGLVAVFGRNHGVYGVIGSLGMMACLVLRQGEKPPIRTALVMWTSGIVVGYLPVLLMMAALPGFAPAFWKSIRHLFEINATNIPLPVPWPWQARFRWAAPMESTAAVLAGMFFVLVGAFSVLAPARVLWKTIRKEPVRPVLAACAFLALPYMHYAYSRADIGHLALGIFPFLIGAFVLAGAQPPKIGWSVAVLLTIGSALATLPQHPAWQCHVRKECVEAHVGGEVLQMHPVTANEITMLNELAAQFAPAGRSFLAAPMWPGAYAVLHRRSPTWETYGLFPRDAAFEQEEIERIAAANPGFAVIIDDPLDGRDELRYRNTHPLINRYVHDHFERMIDYVENPAYQVYRSNPALK